jgi:Zn-dependent membrane protease YugP
MPYYFYGFDPIFFLFALPGLLLGIYAQFRLKWTYNRYSEVESAQGLTGAEAARHILDSAGLRSIPVEEIPGRLTDHFDPSSKALFLSTDNFRGTSISAVGVAAHEAGHALQQQAGFALFNFRMWLVPATRFSSQASYVLFIIGFIFRATPLTAEIISIAVTLFAVTTLFQVVTLPVEYDASRRAKQQLLKLGLVQANESGGVNAVLNAAALTYVAGMVTSILELLYYISIMRGNQRR